MFSFYQQFATALQQNPVVLATVVAVKGSAPREVGAMMLICCDGSLIGTIGGGAGEASVIEQAKRVRLTGVKQPIEIDLSGNLERTKQGICGGKMQVWLERWQGECAIALINDILALLQTGQSGSLIIPFTQERSPYLSTPHFPLPTPLSPTFILSLLPPPTLLIIGAGHVAVPLAQMAHLLDFRVVVQDDRPEFANLQRFPNATVLAQSIDSAVATLPANLQLYAALVTRSYQHDLAALRALLPRSLHYLGMIGSEKRIQTVRQALQHEGIPGMEASVIESRLKAIYAPIGLDLGALTPAEIAVSICAELITVYRGGSERSRSERSLSNRSLSNQSRRVQPAAVPQQVALNEVAIDNHYEQQAQQQ